MRQRTKRLPGVVLGVAAAALVLGGLGNGIAGSQVSAASGHVGSARQHVTAPAGIATVRWIHHGLAVLPPHQGKKKGKLKMRLFSKYGLHTGKGDKASIAFRDGTLLHFNSNTDAVLTSPSSTKVTHGEVQEVLTPGTNHPVQTASGEGAAGGTVFDIKVGSGKTIVTVVEGAVTWSTKKGKVLLKNDQQSIVKPGKKPGAPKIINPATVTGWTKSIPGPSVVEKNVALDSNGGHIVDFSSQATSGGNASFVNDGDISHGWVTAHGQTSNQWVKIGFGPNTAYSLGSVVVDPAVKGLSSSSDLKDFQVRVSTGSTDDSDFTTVFSGTAKPQNVLQRFVLPHSVQARYVELVAVDNNGSSNAIGVGEFEAVAYGGPVTLPAPTQTAACPGDTDLGCMQSVLVQINNARASQNLPILTLSQKASKGTGTCSGAYGHSVAMAKTGDTWHTHAGYPNESFPNDVCLPSTSPGEDVWQQPLLGDTLQQSDLQSAVSTMIGQPTTGCASGTNVSTSCAIFSKKYYGLGVGIYSADGVLWLTLVFLN